jgi:hypothetical protein
MGVDVVAPFAPQLSELSKSALENNETIQIVFGLVERPVIRNLERIQWGALASVAPTAGIGCFGSPFSQISVPFANPTPEEIGNGYPMNFAVDIMLCRNLVVISYVFGPHWCAILGLLGEGLRRPTAGWWL